MAAELVPSASAKTPLVRLFEKTQLRASAKVPDLPCRPFPFPTKLTCSREILTFKVGELVVELIPSSVLSRITVFLTFRRKSLVSLTVIPLPVLNLKITQSSTLTRSEERRVGKEDIS